MEVYKGGRGIFIGSDFGPIIIVNKMYDVLKCLWIGIFFAIDCVSESRSKMVFA